jgi:hypothetical protein
VREAGTAFSSSSTRPLQLRQNSPARQFWTRRRLAKHPTFWLESKNRACPGVPIASVSRMKGVVEVDAGQDCKHVGLEARDQQFERGQRDG